MVVGIVDIQTVGIIIAFRVIEINHAWKFVIIAKC